MQIAFNEVGLKARKYKQIIVKEIGRIIKSGIFLNGQENKKLQKNLERYLGEGYVVLTASGHDSLSLALQSLNLSPKDEVIFPVNAYPTAFPIALSKAKPVPVDVDENGLINISNIKNQISKRTKAIVVVHLYGLVVDMDKVKKLIQNRNIILIEDCAQAFGSKYKRKHVGTLGDISCFSFYPTKNLSTLGDGGAIWTKHKKLYEYFKKAVSYGEGKRYQSAFVSGHSRLPEIQAGILNIYFKTVKKELQKRKKVFSHYQKLFSAYKLNRLVRNLYNNKKARPSLHMFVIETKQRNKLQKHLRQKGIETLIHFPYPIHLLPAFSYLGFKRGDFPIAEKLAKNILSLPFHPYLTKNQVKFVVKSIRDFYYD